MHHNQYSLVSDRDGGGDAEMRSHSPSFKKKYSEVELDLMGGRQSPQINTQSNRLQEDRRNTVIKYAALVTLVIQCTAATLLMRYVRTVPGPRFISSTAVVMQEVIKLIYCMIHLTYTHRSAMSAANEVQREVISKPYDTLKVAVPAFIYAVQNNLIYVAVSNLDAATYQVTYQLKILTTALFSVFMLKRILSGQQWLALLMLFVGVAIVQVDQNASSAASTTPTKDVNPLLGLIVVLVCSMTSGFAGVYFEKVLKSSKVSIWIRNIQLSVFGFLVSLLGAYINDWSDINSKGFFYGYNSLVWTVILIQALGGLLVAMVVKYADNILKGFATSASIIVSCLFVIFAFGVHLSAMFLFGAALVGLATFLYSTGERAASASNTPMKAASVMKS